MSRPRKISKEQAHKEALWLEGLLTEHNMRKKDLADVLGLDNPTNVSHWCRGWKPGGSPIPDIMMLKIGRYFNVEGDVVELRPSLAEYLQFSTPQSLAASAKPKK